MVSLRTEMIKKSIWYSYWTVQHFRDFHGVHESQIYCKTDSKNAEEKNKGRVGGGGGGLSPVYINHKNKKLKDLNFIYQIF